MIKIIVTFESRMNPATGQKDAVGMTCGTEGQDDATPQERAASYPLYRAIMGYLNGLSMIAGAIGTAASIEGLKNLTDDQKEQFFKQVEGQIPKRSITPEPPTPPPQTPA